MDEGQCQSKDPVRRRSTGDSELQNEVGSAHSPDQNQNRLLEEVERGLHGGQKLLRQDSANNNIRDEDEGSRLEEEEEEEEEMNSNSGACLSELDGQLRDSPLLSPSPSACEGPLSPEEIPAGAALSWDLSPSLATSLQALEEKGDHALLPNCLHQIAEALVLEGDYTKALRFLQLQRLYHERVLSNLAALQEQWENRWRLVGQHQDSSSVSTPPPPCDMDTEHLQKLRHICRTHRQPAQSADRCELVAKAQRNNTMSVREEPRSEASSTERVMEEQNSQDGVSPKQDATQPEEGGYVSLRQQGEPELLHMRFPRLPTYSLSATPSSAVTDSPWASGGEEPSESTTAPLTAVKPSTQTPKETQLPGQLRGPGRLMEAGRERVDTEQDPGPSWEKGEEVVAPASLEEVEQVEEEEGLDLEARAEEQERLGSAVPEEELGEEGQGVEALEVGKRTTLDDLAKRIRVEEITPAAGLVSILKRRGSLEGSTTPTIPKPAGKRKVRFRVPDDGLDHDEVGGDSWLLLLLLCLATVVISVGGTALYCTFGDAKSNVCTDFSHNMDFYIGQVQRGIDELRHWFSPSS